ncbi:MAG: hypothetical protein IH831_08960, partial [Planctomycetes bacterium]|nr:hypothetical protein [Planctomycetota bacterium]
NLTLDHTIVAGNIDNTVTRPDVGGNVTASYSLIGDTTGATITDNGGNLLNQNPMLEMLQNNGGATKTHELLAGSPAIDMGDLAASPGVGTVPLFDQRGNNFGRVQNGRIDIGAFEVPSTPSADFDGDGFITGLDFLLWQIGFGIPAPDAVKTDGDADNDLDVDSSDLDIWELQYGTAAPIVAATSASISAESFSTGPLAEPSLASGELADLALAVALAEEANGASGKREFVAHSPPLEFFSAEQIGRSTSVSGSSVSSSATTSTPRDDERQSPEGPSPWEDALDEAFASVFE